MEMADDAAQRLGEGIVADKDRIGRNLRAQQIKGVARTLAAFGLPAGKGQAAGVQHIAQTAQQLGLGGKGMAFQQRRRVAAAIGNGTASHIAAQRVIIKAQGGRAGTGRTLHKADVLHSRRRVGRAIVMQAGKRRRAGHHARLDFANGALLLFGLIVGQQQADLVATVLGVIAKAGKEIHIAAVIQAGQHHGQRFGRAAAQHLRALIKGIAQLLGCLLHLPNLGAADIAFAVEDV